MTPLIIVNKNQCKYKNQIHQIGIQIEEDRCQLEHGHKGPHRGKKGMWVTYDKLSTLVEDHGSSL